MAQTSPKRNPIRIGGACGYWGESSMATPQFLRAQAVDYIVYDYLAEVTMSIMARAKAKNPEAGFATDFISYVLTYNLGEIAESGVKLVTNAGGLNPQACAAAARAMIKDRGLNLKVAVITGDDLMPQKEAVARSGPQEMFTGEPLPDAEKISSINTYLGAFPIAKALDAGADIIITGRCVDSAVTLGICIHEFGWKTDDWDQLASGSLAGHILECGPQATGGNFTDWRLAGDIAKIGYPIALINADGSFDVTKPKGTTGIVNVGTISEQMLYEIGDPQAYMLPDVVCDFSTVQITQLEPDRVHVTQAKGYPAPDTYKTCATYADGFRTGMTLTFYGFDAAARAQVFADAAFARARRLLRMINAPDYTETSIEILGSESQYGNFQRENKPREVVLKIAAKHDTQVQGGILLKEIAGLGLATPPGLSGFQGGRPSPSPVIRLFSYETPKNNITISIDVDGNIIPFTHENGQPFDLDHIQRPQNPSHCELSTDTMTDVPLVALAWGRSGDKGNKANIGIIARKADYLPYIWTALTEQSVAKRFAHFIEGENATAKVKRFFLPGSKAINFLIDDTLGGGGVSSIRNDAQGKGYAQLLLDHPISIPKSLASEFV